MELRHLRYFVAVAEELSFRRAAEKLHIAQPPLGRQIRDLEEELGARLFERDRSGVALTDPGRVFLTEARNLLDAAAAAMAAVRQSARGLRGELRIGNTGPLTATFLPRTLAQFHAQFPEVRVTLVDMGHDEQLAELAAGNIHVAFIGRIGSASESNRFSFETVLSSRVMVALPASHPWAKQPSVSIEKLREQTLINMRPRAGTGYPEWLQNYCKKAGFRPRLHRPASNELPSLFAMVAAGEGVALVPELIVAQASGGEVIFCPLKAPAPPVELVAAWNPANPSVILTNYLAVVRKIVNEAAQQSRLTRGLPPKRKKRAARLT